MKHFLLLVCGLAFCMSLGHCQLCCNGTTEAQCKDTCNNCTSKDGWCCYGLSSQGHCQLCCNGTMEAQCKDTCNNCTSKDGWCFYGLSSQGHCQLCCNGTTEAQCKDTCNNCTSKDGWCFYGLSSQAEGNFSADRTCVIFCSQNKTVPVILKSCNTTCCKTNAPNAGSFMKVSPLLCLALLTAWFA